MKARTAVKTLMVFVDGLGIGCDDPTRNPVVSGACPTLAELIKKHSVPIDACLDTPGLPQSATGQSSLLTGVNAAKVMGRHLEGVPGPKLKALLADRNIFGRLRERGYSPAFANAFYVDSAEEVRQRRRQSATTVAALAGLGGVRDKKAMIENRAVYQDLTRDFLREHGYSGPSVTPEEAAHHLRGIAEENDFTLFEFFQTDIISHKGTPNEVRDILSRLDEFIEALMPFSRKPEHLFVLTSDHGNIEDSTHRRHTKNSIPFVAVGDGAGKLLARVRSLTDFVPALLDELYP